MSLANSQGLFNAEKTCREKNRGDIRNPPI